MGKTVVSVVEVALLMSVGQVIYSSDCHSNNPAYKCYSSVC